MKFKNINEVWDAIDKGHRVFWVHEGYEVLVEPDPCPDKKLSSNRGLQCLRVTYLENWFGSRLNESQLSQLFIKRGVK